METDLIVQINKMKIEKEIEENLLTYVLLVIGFILGICGVQGWGWLIFLAIIVY